MDKVFGVSQLRQPMLYHYSLHDGSLKHKKQDFVLFSVTYSQRTSLVAKFITWHYLGIESTYYGPYNLIKFFGSAK